MTPGADRPAGLGQTWRSGWRSAASELQATLERDDASTHLEVRVSPVYQDQAGLAGWLAVFRDVTARVHAEEAERNSAR